MRQQSQRQLNCSEEEYLFFLAHTRHIRNAMTEAVIAEIHSQKTGNKLLEVNEKRSNF